MPAVYRHELIVREDEVDDQGHVGNLEYLKWMVQAAVAHSTAQGWPASRYQEIGAGWVVRSHHIEYLQPAFAGENLAVLTWVASFRRIQSVRKYRVLRLVDRASLAVGETNWAFISLQQRTPQRIPGELIASFELVPQDPEP